MGLEKKVTGVRLCQENEEFVYEVERNFRPYKLSDSALMDMFVSIVRVQYRRGDLNLEPKALQELFSSESLLRKQNGESLQPTKAVPIGRKR